MSSPQGLTVSMVMTPFPECLAYDATLAEAARFLIEEGISGAPVVGRDGRAMRVISTTDVLRTIAAEVFDGTRCPDLSELKRRRVDDIVQRFPVTCEPLDTLESVCKLMLKQGVHRVIVVMDGSPIGVVSAIDVVRAVSYGKGLCAISPTAN